MTVTPGSGYEKYKAILREKIREGTIKTIETEANGENCYFCSNPIKGKMRFLIDKYNIRGCEAEDRRPIHESCYHQTKLFFYFNEIPFSFS